MPRRPSRPSASRSQPARPDARDSVVTALRAKPSDPSLVEVVVGGEPLGIALRSEVERLGVREGATLSAAKRRALIVACERARARTVALKALARRDRSRAALEAELVERHGIDASIAAAVLAELAADGWQDDRRFAEQRAEELVARRGVAAHVIEATLAADGIGETLAKRAARAAAPPASERQRAIELARAFFAGETDAGRRSLAGEAAERGAKSGDRRGSAGAGRSGRASAGASSAVPTVADARRVARRLAQRGYEADTILAALAACGFDTSSIDAND